jgi:hypothetical protein
MTMCRACAMPRIAMPRDAVSVQVGESPYFPPGPGVGTVQETVRGTH